MRKVRIFDTTLRDGEQSPGASMNAREKLEVAAQLARLNVDALEAGFPISSRGDFDSVRQVAREIRGPVIAALARANKADIDCAGDALRPARRRRIHTFIATSDIHMQKKLKKSPAEVLALAVGAVKMARVHTDDVQFSPEDATRTRPDFLARVVSAALKAGATTINIPDTVGYGTPSEFGRIIKGLYARVPGLRKAVIAVHCHNDLGLSVASSLAGVEAGAGQVECTINGIGERAGNASLEEVVMALKTRHDYYKCETQVVTEELWRASRLVSRLTGLPVQANKAIVGANAFAHEAGIHQHGVIMDRETYEIMTPESVGVPESRLVLGKHSGRHMVRRKLDELGLVVPEGEVDRIYTALMALADRKKYVYDEDVIALVEGSTGASADVWVLDDLAISTGKGRTPTATIRLRKGEKVAKSSGRGDGPVDATYRAIDRLTRVKPELVDYSLRAITSGKDAQGEVTVRLRAGSREVSGRGASTDIIEASAKAYLNGVNRLLRRPAGGANRVLGRV
jgi:2-isopropylmalate synthase